MSSTPDPTDTATPPSPDHLFELIQERAQSIVEFHLITQGATLTAADKDVLRLGMSAGIQASVELLVGSR
jgi:hypothetical protein